MSITAPLCQMTVLTVGAMVSMEFLALIQTASSTTPVPVYTQDVLNGKTIKQITTGYYHTCVIASDNKDYCWGYGTFGRLGNNGIVQKNAPYPVREFATTVVSQNCGG